MDKVDSMQEQMGNVNREMEILRKKPKTARDTKHAFGGLISRLDTGRERIS